MSPSSQCPCHSGKDYGSCCRPFHEGETLPKSPLQLMRSRYSGYALGLIDYILETTHPNYRPTDRASVEQFCQENLFVNLEILDHDKATVTFRAHLNAFGRPYSFTEKSQFEIFSGKLMYTTGQVS